MLKGMKRFKRIPIMVNKQALSKHGLESIEERTKIFKRHLNETFLKRYTRRPTIKKWTRSLSRLAKISRSVTIEQPKEQIAEQFVPAELRSIVALFDEIQ